MLFGRRVQCTKDDGELSMNPYPMAKVGTQLLGNDLAQHLGQKESGFSRSPGNTFPAL